MIRVSVMYPNSENVSFDMDYYATKHMPMVAGHCGDALRGMTIDSGLGGGAPGEAPTYIAMGHLIFDSMESFHAAFGPHMAEIMGDIPNYTAATPVIQFSEVTL